MTDAAVRTGLTGSARPLLRRLPDPRPGPGTLSEMLPVVLRHRWKVLAPLVLGPVVGVALALLVPPTFRAQSDILVRSGREYLPQSDTGGSVGAPATTRQEDITSEIAILKSRAVAEATIDAVGLATLFPDLAEGPPHGMSPVDAAVEAFNRALSVEPVKLSSIISVSYDAPSTTGAKAALDHLVAAYVAKHAAVFAGSRTEGYGDAATRIRAELDRTEARLSRLKLAASIYDLPAQRAALINARQDAESRMEEAGSRQSVLRQRLGYLQARRPLLPDVVQSTTTDRDTVSAHARQALGDLRRTEAALATRLGDGNPELRQVRAQIAAAAAAAAGMAGSRTNVGVTPSPLAQSVDSEIIMNTAELLPLDDVVARYKALRDDRTAELQRLEAADEELRTTAALIGALTDSYKAAQARYEQARTVEQTELAHQVSVVPIAPAVASERPVRPRRLVFAAGGMLAGLLLAGGVAVLAVLTDRTLATEDAAERLLGLPVLATLPFETRAGYRRPAREQAE